MFIWYILLLIVTIVGINIIIDYIRYGKKLFDCFKKRNDEFSMKDLLINVFKREIRNKVLILERNNDYFIAFTKYDIFLIQLINQKENISGSINDVVLKTKKKEEIINPLPQFIKEIKLLLNNNEDIKPIIVKTSKDCVLNLIDFDKRNIFTLNDFTYLLYRLQHSTIRYSENELDNKYNEIKRLLDGNN